MSQTVDVQLTAFPAPFKHGTALVTASMTVCDGFVPCHTATDTEEVTCRK